MRRSLRSRGQGSTAIFVAALAVALAVPASASAAFHLVKVTEVYPGTGGFPDSAFVELQMYEPGQNLVGGHEITTYTAAGAEIHSFTLPANVPSGGNQRSILVADQFPPDAVQADFTDTALGTQIVPSGGAVCFDAVDCVTWGNYAGPAAALPSTGGQPAAPGGIPDGNSLVRSTAPGCPTLLENGDDTNSSAADFTLIPDPAPRANATAPTETGCSPETVIDKGPKKKIRKKRARFVFSSPAAGAGFECALDRKAFKPCQSPHRVKVKRGRHVFRVRAVLNGFTDKSPATYKFKRKKKRR